MSRSLVIACVLSAGLAWGFSRPVAADEGEAEARTAELVRQRAKLARLHRVLGLTTWISLAGTVAVGTLRYANATGFGEPLCAEGNSPIFGREFGCGMGLRTWHLVAASVTMLSYVATRVIAAKMPDPLDAASGNTSFSRRLRIHRLLSWVHLTGMIASAVLGFATTATDDAGTRDALAASHLVAGYFTLAAVSTAGSLMAF
ncbi:MAG: hypothetical protein HYY06_16020 [Deltaproteobacteria bacterium]|nr:hypothetical protein [Deltaproteobacteria bacterium]